MFASLDEAVAEDKSKATTLANGELDALHLRAEDARVYVCCAQMAKSTGIPLDLQEKDAVEAVKSLNQSFRFQQLDITVSCLYAL